MTKDNLFEGFFSSYNEELKSKVKRLDNLIGRDHWLSVGNYKESILRDLLSNVLPDRFKANTGFIVSADEDGNAIKSKQIDILIWDSNDYAPIFKDGDFVIVPPEACKAIIEVKGKLTREGLYQSLSSADSVIDFVRTPLLPTTSGLLNIRKYIFAYEIENGLNFPTGIFDSIARFYDKKANISLKERLKYIEQSWPSNLIFSLFSIDAVFVLSHGAIIRNFRGFRDKSVRLLFNAFSTNFNNIDHTYSYFEYVVQGSINCDGRSEFSYSKQPGLFSVLNNLSIKKTTPKNLMIYPPITTDDLYSDIKSNEVYIPK